MHWQTADEGDRMPSALTDRQLIEKSREAPAHFAELFDRYHAELYRYLRRRAGPAIAADVASETFLTAFARRDRYQPETSSAMPWLYGIAHNILRNHARSERRQWLAYARHGEGSAADYGAVDAFATADRRADAASDAAAIGRVMDRLPAGDRDVLLLFAWADMSYADIASTLQIPVGTVRSRLNRARRRLRGIVQPDPSNLLIGESHG
jgi:RNA polymerase sigma factor (sigma-70 family)